MNAKFPVSDHCDGQRFFNLGSSQPSRGLLQVLRWRFQGSQRVQWPSWVNDPKFPPPPETVGAGQAAITFINHATFLLRLSGITILTDPIFSLRCSPVDWAGPRRVRSPGIALAQLPRPDVVLLSHNHYDHMDLPSLRTIQTRFAPKFITTLGNAAPLAHLGIQATELDWWQDVTVDGLHVTLTPARHFSARTPFDRNRTLWGGFMLRAESGQIPSGQVLSGQIPSGQILFAGDSGFGAHWQDIRSRLGAPDIALLPIGAYEPRWFMAPVHMNPPEAVQAHLVLGARHSIAMHYGTFQLTDEAIDAPLTALAEARRAAGLPDESFIALGFGETRLFPMASS